MGEAQPVGAYGFRLEGAGHRLLLPVPHDWHAIHVLQEVVDEPEPVLLEIGNQRAIVPLVTGGMISVDRNPPQATIKDSHRLTEEEIAHPYLAPIAALHAHWLGRSTFHGGALVVGNGAWGVLGGRQAGKSSLLAEAIRRGLPVVADDLLILEGLSVFAGPRSVDLRESAATHFAGGRRLGVVGLRERWRLELASVPPSFPLTGWIFLRWGSVPAIEPLTLTDRLVRLAAGRYVRVESADPAPLLNLAALPALQLTGIKRWDALPPLFDHLLETIERLETPV